MSAMSDPDTFPAGAPRLLTIAQAAAETRLSAKAIARRIERGHPARSP
jgi:hypothetical protein